MDEHLKKIITVTEEPMLEAERGKLPQHYAISFDRVNFGNQDKLAARELNLEIPENSILALVGGTGSGNATIASLIACCRGVDTGRIKIGGVDIRHIKQDKFYSLITNVFQDVDLVDDTIYNNIKIGKPDASEEEIIAAADKAQVLDFAWELPKGMYALIGNGGNKLSDSQKQRISIARALLKDTPIVLLDEATASPDLEDELYVQQVIQELVKLKTVVVIAHKLATIQQADQILVLKDGEMAELGTHSALLAKQGIYRSMWDIQQKSRGWKV
ncbi:ATP-binding cassette domain-containing protein [Olivibacter sp. 47]|uniref:ABC transporter ATP-binding protein n=1 Tax=Olivibacter sp. 47 TaxID=3056486 RepID=UPI0025A3AB27|nr:ATP-binding cassette domain-containing protein [Olivibacter sp. 47]MDM8178100.1 ATP-binding cassette domain-containing protein [Olivibacter sp. 47]